MKTVLVQAAVGVVEVLAGLAAVDVVEPVADERNLVEELQQTPLMHFSHTNHKGLLLSGWGRGTAS